MSSSQSRIDAQLAARLTAVLERLLDSGRFRAALVLEKGGECLVSRGETDAMESAAVNNFGAGLSLGHLCRDADGSTFLAGDSGDAVRLEAVGARYILTMVCADPLVPQVMREAIDDAKRQLEEALGEKRRED